MDQSVIDARQRQYDAHMAKVVEIVEAESGRKFEDLPEGVLDGLFTNQVATMAEGPRTTADKILARLA